MQDHEDSVREHSQSEHHSACTARIITEQKNKYYLLLQSEQILVCIFSALLQLNLLSCEQETLFFKLISWLSAVRFSNFHLTVEKSSSSHSQHILRIIQHIQLSNSWILNLHTDAAAWQVWWTSHSEWLQSTSFLMRRCQMSNKTLHDEWSSENN